MLEVICCLSIFLLEICRLHIGIGIFYEPVKMRKKLLPLCILFGICIPLCIEYYSGKIVVCISIAILSSVILHKGKFLSILAATLISVFFYFNLDTLFDYVFNGIMQYTGRGELWYDAVRYIFSGTLSLLWILLIVGIRIKFGNKNKPVSLIYIYTVLAIMGMALLFAFAGLDATITYVKDSPQLSALFHGASVFGKFAMCMIGLLIIDLRKVNGFMHSYLETERQLKNTQKEYYELLLKKEEETRKFRHDIQNHMYCIQLLLEQKEEKKALEYIEEIQMHMTKIHTTVYQTGQDLIDGLLNFYLDKIQYPVKIEVKGKCAGKINLSDFEVCTIFSNLILNAVENINRQTEEDAKRYFRCEVQEGKHFVKYIFENSFCLDLKQGEKTIKGDKKNHGYGLENVQKTLLDNHGELCIEKEENCFRIIVSIPLESDRLRS